MAIRLNPKTIERTRRRDRSRSLKRSAVTVENSAGSVTELPVVVDNKPYFTGENRIARVIIRRIGQDKRCIFRRTVIRENDAARARDLARNRGCVGAAFAELIDVGAAAYIDRTRGCEIIAEDANDAIAAYVDGI